MEWLRRRRAHIEEAKQQEELAVRNHIIQSMHSIMEDPLSLYGFTVECQTQFKELIVDILREHAKKPYIVIHDPNYNTGMDKIRICYIQQPQPRPTEASEDPAANR